MLFYSWTAPVSHFLARPAPALVLDLRASTTPGSGESQITRALCSAPADGGDK